MVVKIKSIEFISGKNSTGFLYYSSEEKKLNFCHYYDLLDVYTLKSTIPP